LIPSRAIRTAYTAASKVTIMPTVRKERSRRTRKAAVSNGTKKIVDVNPTVDKKKEVHNASPGKPMNPT